MYNWTQWINSTNLFNALHVTAGGGGPGLKGGTFWGPQGTQHNRRKDGGMWEEERFGGSRQIEGFSVEDWKGIGWGHVGGSSWRRMTSVKMLAKVWHHVNSLSRDFGESRGLEIVAFWKRKQGSMKGLRLSSLNGTYDCQFAHLVVRVQSTAVHYSLGAFISIRKVYNQCTNFLHSSSY